MPDRGAAYIDIDLTAQRLRLVRGGEILREYAVSTAASGPGELIDSGCTPRGWHVIRAKIGAGYPPNTVFVGRRPTGELYGPELRQEYPGRDWILTRILWLSGLEKGRNRLGDVDTMRRYIYIHGCPDDLPTGVPDSHGCVRMRNTDVMDLFDRVDVGTRVHIHG
ncbi:MAG: L,D-transpeptidase [Gammaproteobacteria bacterium]|nr:L,D-transpeptidase [Gammaproteobacteria bacterium]NIR84974.1 L,D-transpeptidase [Gammaproteobacteria bacterium]NIR91823.1 L,D-transpeptidase [Gammaproteobacteria bacterium]NIU06021.1 L,D-transpeptidase [Gammaproteobacteria bacterium]NIV53068.1 L,D-transpeptidase family protein [Gammaproteobacteria bacterium]